MDEFVVAGHQAAKAPVGDDQGSRPSDLEPVKGVVNVLGVDFLAKGNVFFDPDLLRLMLVKRIKEVKGVEIIPV